MRIERLLGIVAVLVGLGASGRAMADDKAKPKETQLLLPGPVAFATNSDQLVPAADSALEFVAGYLVAHKDVAKLRIEVHSDARGAEAYNLKMSKLRAAAVARWLVAKGVACGDDGQPPKFNMKWPPSEARRTFKTCNFLTGALTGTGLEPNTARVKVLARSAPTSR